MIFALLFIGLLPVVFLPDIFDTDGADTAGNGLDDGSEPNPGTEGLGDILDPQEDDPDPGEPIPVDESEVLDPDEGDDNPEDFNTVVDPGEVIDPNEDIEDAYRVDGDGSLLQQLLAEQSDATAGSDFLGARVSDTLDTELGALDDDLSLADDGVEGTGEGTLGSWDGTPLVQSEGDINVVSGGEGDDTLAAGDEAAYLFGGAGNDSLSAGEGAAALFGGDGDDVLTGSDFIRADGTASTYLDGGRGDDRISGGDANEVISGGEHDSDSEPGNDILSGGGGDDAIRGGLGADVLSGGDGDDVLDHYGNSEELVRAEQRDFGWHIDNDADVLDGGDGNDTLIFDRADTATGGEGNDTFWLYHDSDSGAGYAEITDFTSGEDFLRISLNPEVTNGTPDVSVSPSEDGLDGIVEVNGEVVAILRGAPGATLADLYVDVPQNIFG